MSEEWRAIAGYEGLYEVSSEGRVRSLDRLTPDGRLEGATRIRRGRMLSLPALRGGRYSQVTLSRDGHRVNRSVHALVAEAFIGPRLDGMEVCHQNGNGRDNRVENLRYDTGKGNAADRKAHGTLYRYDTCLRGHELTRGVQCKKCLREREVFHYSREQLWVKQERLIEAAVQFKEATWQSQSCRS